MVYMLTHYALTCVYMCVYVRMRVHMRGWAGDTGG